MNKIYTKTVFSLLTLSTYVINKALGSEPISSEYMLANSIKHRGVYDPNEIYEQNKDLICIDHEETREAAGIMNDALDKLYYYAKNGHLFNVYKEYNRDASSHFNNYIDYADIGKFYIKIRYPHTYNEIVSILWDPNGEKKYNPDFVSGKVARAYNPNLLMIQKRYETSFMSPHKYFYALAEKYKESETRTIIVMSSGNSNEHNRRNRKRYVNAIVKSATSFEASIDSEEDIRNGELKKMFVHLSGYVITKYIDHVEIIHIDSIDGDTSASASKSRKLSNKSKRMERLMELSDYINHKYI
ncbi:Acidic phosphoprotein precursor PCEMA1, putative [Plasmodium chabaudi adami]|uniref:Acidic phosphoprotein PCEMA1, putative n=1 Tax=Plasmodium chabaudi adami TaxID=5826 RepID=A0A1C6WUN7_PLACE|nr:Acidic phosphoprotein precursor PCEMA1, putative [Plasmodium chabaudi adami]